MQEKLLELQRGLFLLKYESADHDINPPKILVAPESGNRHIDLVLPPDAEDAVLWSPGACLVVRATAPGRLRVSVVPTVANGSMAARIQLVGLSADPKGMRSTEEAADVDLSNFRVLGHVAGFGDVFSSANEWIAGPSAPSRIEGIAIEWPDKPDRLRLRYAVKVGGPRPAMTPFVQAGGFAGTRGRSLPLVGATFELSESSALDLIVDTLFLGSPQMRVTGQRVVVAGPSGREPLVGLRVSVVNRFASDQPAWKDDFAVESAAYAPERSPVTSWRNLKGGKQPPRPQLAPTVPPKRPRTVRVFRSKTRDGGK